MSPQKVLLELPPLPSPHDTGQREMTLEGRLRVACTFVSYERQNCNKSLSPEARTSARWERAEGRWGKSERDGRGKSGLQGSLATAETHLRRSSKLPLASGLRAGGDRDGR